MKIARLLLLAALLSSAFSSAAFTPDQAVGFIQLVPAADAELPVAAQALRALPRLMPELLEAQSAGQIISFDLSPSSGVLKIVYRPSAGLPDVAGKTVYSRVQDAAAALGAPEALTCTAPLFQLFMYQMSFRAGCLTPGARILGGVRDPSGRPVAVYSGIVDATGALNYPFFTWGPPTAAPVPGYIVTFKEYVGGTLVATFRTKVPDMKFTSISKASAIVKGTGPMGKPVTLTWYHDKLDAGDTEMVVTKNRTISSAGTWQVDFGAIPIRGRDFLVVDAYRTANFAFTDFMEAPYMYCRLGGNYCRLKSYRLTPVTMQITHGGQTYNFSGTTDKWGFLEAPLKTPLGMPVLLSAYDKVSATGIAQYGLPKLTANINYITDTVSGKAPPYKYFHVWLQKLSTNMGYPVYSHSNGSGIYSINFMTAHGVDLLPGNPYVIEVEFIMPSTGNVTDLYKVYGP